jgi:hypothetical protein
LLRAPFGPWRPLVADNHLLAGHRCIGLGHLTDLFLVLAGLADGLAPKERRYA